MPLEPGTTLGSYQVTAKIGEGGMGEVYRARDTKLDRDVALKVLPQAFTEDPDRLARFEREAKVLASLNHPGIAGIYGLEESGDTRALVLELVEGPTLADRIAKGPIPLDEALPIAKQIAEALEAAHEAGVIHRDLKPANIKVREDGTVKVLDFGLAKALDPTPEGDPSQSPTLTAAATQMGVIMGTAAYMSPEQARGKPVDRRADIWAFGCVLYEMLTGRRAFEGEDVSLTLADVMRADPPWELLPSHLPDAVATYLKRCLAKDAKQRVQAIGDVRLAMDGVFDVAARTGAPAKTPTSRSPIGRQLRLWVAGAAVGCVVGAGTVWSLRQPAPTSPAPLMRVDVTAPAQPLKVSGNHPDVAVSPDNQHIVYLSGKPSDGFIESVLVVRPLDELAGRRLEATAGVPSTGPFISPDSKWVGFYEGGSGLKRVSMLGGPAIPICDLPGQDGGRLRGASWGTDGTIVFGTEGRSGLWRVPADGGDPQMLTTPEGAENHVWPEVLPGGHAVVFTMWTSTVEDAQLAVVDLEGSTQTVLVPSGHFPRYLASGHLIYVSGTSLWAVGFDLDRLVVTTAPVRVLENISSAATGATNIGVSATGSLVYVAGEAPVDVKTLVWVNADGTEEDVGAPARDYYDPRVSPDGQRVVVSIDDRHDRLTFGDIWIWDIARRVFQRLTDDRRHDIAPIWTPDGRGIVYASGGLDAAGFPLFQKPAIGTGDAVRIVEEGQYLPQAWSRDGMDLFVSSGPPSLDLGILRMGDTPSVEWLLDADYAETSLAVSPDGEWIAYASDETGAAEVYVRSFPNTQENVQRVSSGGGAGPRWAPDGKSLFYWSGQAMMRVPVEFSPEFALGQPERLFEGPYLAPDAGPVDYDVAPDGRFLMLKPVETDETGGARVILVQNWEQELKRLVPTE